MKIMILNSNIKQNSKTIFGVIRNLILDFILYFVTAYIIWESTLYMYHEHRVKHQIHYASLEDVSKKRSRQTIYNSNYRKKCSKLLQLKMYI